MSATGAQRGRPLAAVKIKPKVTRLNVDVDAELLKKLRIYAVQNDTTVAELMREELKKLVHALKL
jgi:post-segregation antitoxin (ccd killing protein)